MSAAYPAYTGLSTSRTSLLDLASPDAFDWNQIVLEVIKHQTLINGTVRNFSAVVTTNGSNVSDVAISCLDDAGNVVTGNHVFEIWLSDDAGGNGLTGTTASGTVTAKSASGNVFVALVAKKLILVQTLATGIFTLEITDSGKTAFVVCAKIPSNGLTKVVTTLATASYG